MILRISLALFESGDYKWLYNLEDPLKIIPSNIDILSVDADMIKIHFPIYKQLTKREAEIYLKKIVNQCQFEWFYQSNSLWVIDLDLLKNLFSKLFDKYKWLHGKAIFKEPEIEVTESNNYRKVGRFVEKKIMTNLCFYLDKDNIQIADNSVLLEKYHIILDEDLKKFTFKEKTIPLTKAEVTFLKLLFMNLNCLCTYDDLMGLTKTYSKSYHINNSASRLKSKIASKLGDSKDEFLERFSVNANEGYVFKFDKEKILIK